MRALLPVLALLIAGCVPNSPEPGRSPTPQSTGSGVGGPAAEEVVQDDPEKYKVLYTDAEIERLVGEGIDDLKENGRIILDVVPNGTTRPLREVFEALGLDEGRMRYEWAGPIMMIIIVDWRVSPSYELWLMTYEGAENRGLGLRDPNRQVYGVRIEKYRESLP